jgi:hypothetical protein
MGGNGECDVARSAARSDPQVSHQPQDDPAGAKLPEVTDHIEAPARSIVAKALDDALAAHVQRLFLTLTVDPEITDEKVRHFNAGLTSGLAAWRRLRPK